MIPNIESSVYFGEQDKKIHNCTITLIHHIRLAKPDSENISNLLVTLPFGCSIIVYLKARSCLASFPNVLAPVRNKVLS